MRKIYKYIIIIILLIIPSYNVKAVTLGDLYSDLNSLEKSYNASKKKSNLTEAELKNIKASIANTENEVKQVQNDIVKTEAKIKESEKKIAAKKEETNQMLLYLQLSSGQGDSMLEYIFESDSYTDFIYRYAVVSQMSDYNNKLLDELNTLIKEMNNQKAILNQKQISLANKQKELQGKYAIVQAQNKEAKEEGLSIADQISEKRKLIKYYESIGCTRSQNVNTCIQIAAARASARNRSRGSSSGGGSGTASSAGGGWVYPVSSFVLSSLYAEKRGSVRHYAVDLATSEGHNVFAVKDGIVISAHGSSCGGMTVQIYHPSADIVSLYMHLIEANVSIGTHVKAGQVIGISGGGSREIAVWGDYCTQGAHLHFAMSYGSGLIGYSSQKGSTFNPGDIFPRMG